MLTPFIRVKIGDTDVFTVGDGHLQSFEVALSEGGNGNNCQFEIYDPGRVYADKYFKTIFANDGLDPLVIAQQQGGTGGDLGSVPSQIGQLNSVNGGSFAGVRLSSSRVGHALTIIRVGQQVGATERDVVIALMVAMQESSLDNIPGGDRDSGGLYQQRPSQEWGSRAQITNPEYSARAFYTGAGSNRGLLDFPNRTSRTLGQAGQAVQRSAHPDAYDKWEPMARALLAAATSEAATPPSTPVAAQAALDDAQNNPPVETPPTVVETNTGQQITIELGFNGEIYTAHSFLHQSLKLSMFAPDRLTFSGQSAVWVLTQRITNTSFTNITFKRFAEKVCEDFGLDLDMPLDGPTYEFFPVRGVSLYEALLVEAHRIGLRVHNRGRILTIRPRDELLIQAIVPSSARVVTTGTGSAGAIANTPTPTPTSETTLAAEIRRVLNREGNARELEGRPQTTTPTAAPAPIPVGTTDNTLFVLEFGDNMGDSFEVSHSAQRDGGGGARASAGNGTSSTGQRKFYIDGQTGEVTAARSENPIGTGNGAIVATTGSHIAPISPVTTGATDGDDTARRENEMRIKGIVASGKFPTTPVGLLLTPDSIFRTSGVSEFLDRVWVLDTIKHSWKGGAMETSFSCYTPLKNRNPGASEAAPGKSAAPGAIGQAPPPGGINEAIYRAALALEGASSANDPGTNGGRVACVARTNAVLARAGVPNPWNNSLAVRDARSALSNPQVATVINPADARPGDIWVAGGTASSGRRNHIGIVVGANEVLSNSSSRASFRWRHNFSANGSYDPPITIFRLRG